MSKLNLTPEDQKLQEDIEVVQSSFICAHDMSTEFERYYAKIRTRDQSKLPLNGLATEFLAYSMSCDAKYYGKELLTLASGVMKDLAEKEKTHADIVFTRSWDPINQWFNDEYPVFMEDVQRLPRIRKDFYKARDKAAKKPTEINQAALLRAAENYKAHTDIIKAKLADQSKAHTHHKHCIEAYMSDTFNYHKAFYRNNSDVMQKIGAIMNAHLPPQPVFMKELPAHLLTPATPQVQPLASKNTVDQPPNSKLVSAPEKRG